MRCKFCTTTIPLRKFGESWICQMCGKPKDHTTTTTTTNENGDHQDVFQHFNTTTNTNNTTNNNNDNDDNYNKNITANEWLNTTQWPLSSNINNNNNQQMGATSSTPITISDNEDNLQSNRTITTVEGLTNCPYLNSLNSFLTSSRNSPQSKGIDIPSTNNYNQQRHFESSYDSEPSRKRSCQSCIDTSCRQHKRSDGRNQENTTTNPLNFTSMGGADELCLQLNNSSLTSPGHSNTDSVSSVNSNDAWYPTNRSNASSYSNQSNTGSMGESFHQMMNYDQELQHLLEQQQQSIQQQQLQQQQYPQQNILQSAQQYSLQQQQHQQNCQYFTNQNMANQQELLSNCQSDTPNLHPLVEFNGNTFHQEQMFGNLQQQQQQHQQQQQLQQQQSDYQLLQQLPLPQQMENQSQQQQQQQPHQSYQFLMNQNMTSQTSSIPEMVICKEEPVTAVEADGDGNT